jgi:hypothetical protein
MLREQRRNCLRRTRELPMTSSRATEELTFILTFG